MSDDKGEVQSKSDRPAASPGLLRPASPPFSPPTPSPSGPESPTGPGSPAASAFPAASSPAAPPAPNAAPPAPGAVPPVAPPGAVPPGAVPPGAAPPPGGAYPYPPVVPPAPAGPTYPPVPARPVPPNLAVDTDDEDDEDDADEDELPLTFVERLRRLPPAPVILTAGSIGSLLFLLRAVTSHTTPVAILLSAAVVTGFIFGVDGAAASVACWRASREGESGRALGMAVVGGFATLVSAGAFAGTLLMVLVLNS